MAYNFVTSSSQFISSTGLSITGPNPSVYPSTLSVWAYANSNTIAMTILTWLNTASSQRFQILFAGQVVGDPVRFNTQGASLSIRDKTNPGFVINTWHHVCFVCTSATQREGYLDAVSGFFDTTNITPVNLSAVNIGCLSNGQFFDGNISDVAIWSVALNTSEISSLAKGFSAKKIRPQRLEYYVPLVRDLYEYKDKPTLTNNNSATVTPHSRIYS